MPVRTDGAVSSMTVLPSRRTPPSISTRSPARQTSRTHAPNRASRARIDEPSPKSILRTTRPSAFSTETGFSVSDPFIRRAATLPPMVSVCVPRRVAFVRSQAAVTEYRTARRAMAAYQFPRHPAGDRRAVPVPFGTTVVSCATTPALTVSTLAPLKTTRSVTPANRSTERLLAVASASRRGLNPADLVDAGNASASIVNACRVLTWMSARPKTVALSSTMSGPVPRVTPGTGIRSKSYSTLAKYRICPCGAGPPAYTRGKMPSSRPNPGVVNRGRGMKPCAPILN